MELTFAGVVHDLARPLNDVYHGEIMAEIVRDRVDPCVYDVLRSHGAYQDALIHKKAMPMADPHTHKYAMIFCHCEAASFEELGNQPSLTEEGALDLIYTYLD